MLTALPAHLPSSKLRRLLARALPLNRSAIFEMTSALLVICSMGCFSDNYRKPSVGFGFLKDQLRRASSSVVLNYSEGFAKQSQKERQRYFRIARGSVLEVAAIFDVAQGWDLIDEPSYLQGHDLCDHVSALLYQFR